ncbi:uncharacterized protein LOC141847395 [Curcuma longa]|uniref:uncharacterized protein LOC141847395 n=1 Tax=Curcuma longa TaxID=136217 RepID=UPI003D9E6837
MLQRSERRKHPNLKLLAETVLFFQLRCFKGLKGSNKLYPNLKLLAENCIVLSVTMLQRSERLKQAISKPQIVGRKLYCSFRNLSQHAWLSCFKGNSSLYLALLKI